MTRGTQQAEPQLQVVTGGGAIADSAWRRTLALSNRPDPESFTYKQAPEGDL